MIKPSRPLADVPMAVTRINRILREMAWTFPNAEAARESILGGDIGQALTPLLEVNRRLREAVNEARMAVRDVRTLKTAPKRK